MDNAKLITIADSNRYHCTECISQIKKGEVMFRRYYPGYKSSVTINLCRKCITKMIVLSNITNKEIKQVAKEMMVANI